MGISVEPTPLHEPLAGGTRGATVTVEPLIAGHVDFAREMMVKPEGRFTTARLLKALLIGSATNVVPVPAFLIRHPSAGAILVDTGLHPSIATDPKANFGTLASRSGKPTLEPGEDVPAQLRERGLGPGEVPIVVMTHMHLDHTSAISEFPELDLRRQRDRVAVRGARLEPAAERLPPLPLRLRLRLPHGLLRPRRDRLLRQLRPLPSTSSPTARSTSPSPPATAPATCR